MDGDKPQTGPPQAKILTFGLISDGWDTIWQQDLVNRARCRRKIRQIAGFQMARK